MIPTSAPHGRTPLYHWHVRHGARMANRDGWQVPLVCSSVEQEVAAARSGVALADISALEPEPAGQGLAGLWLLGPRVDEVLRQLTSLDLAASLPRGARAETGVAGIHALLIRTNSIPLENVQLHIAWDLGEYVWENLLHAGRQVGIVPLGLDALDMLRRPGG
jgi:glycine cleavage system aminomethyltransferase T